MALFFIIVVEDLLTIVHIIVNNSPVGLLLVTHASTDYHVAASQPGILDLIIPRYLQTACVLYNIIERDLSQLKCPSYSL